MINYLTTQFLHPANFQLAWEKVAANNGCAGVDGETIAQFTAHADENLARLLKAVATGEYRPMPLLQFFIPKKQGGWRSLSVPTVRGRIVQQAMLQVLHPVMEVHFEACSFAYRPGRSHLMAVREVAFDLMEEFRSPIVDTLVIKLVNQKILKPTDFTWPDAEGGVYLTDTARRVFLKHFEERISLKITIPDVQNLVSYRRVIQRQVQRYKQALLQGTPYEAFIRVD